jgi:prepilin-type N-terminal cleavage/methylation domain-containing protein
MKTGAISHGGRSGRCARGICSHRAFTLVEIMVVIGIMGIVLGMGVPSILRALQKEGLRKAVSDVQDLCNTARARAIFSSETTALVFHPLERRFEIGSAGSAEPAQAQPGGFAVEKARSAGSGQAGRLPDDISIEMLDINLLEYRESDVARVRFFPNGTSDEMTLILLSSKHERCEISLEITTGLASVETDPQKFGK